MQGPLGPGIEAIDQHLGHCRAHIAAFLQHDADRVHDIAAGSVLADVAVGACAQQVDRVLLFRVGAYHEHRQVRISAADQLERIDAIAIGKGNVQHEQVAGRLPEQGERFGAARRLAAHLEVRLEREQLLQPRADDFVVVDEDDAPFFHVAPRKALAEARIVLRRTCFTCIR